MGNGLVRRYQAPQDEAPEHNAWRKPKAGGAGGSKAAKAAAKGKAKAAPQPEFDHNAWRQPRQKVPGDGGPAASRVSPGAASSAASGAGGGNAAHREKAAQAASSAAMWSLSSAEGHRAPATSSAAVPEEEEDDDDFSEFAFLADAANKVWDDLLKHRGNAGKDFNLLFNLTDLKDNVERAVKRTDCLRREAAVAASKAEEKQKALEDLCSRIEERTQPAAGQSVQWKLGDIAIRRGKGLCELSTVHYDSDPPYFEVRMSVNGNLIGVEAGNLLPLTPPQQSGVRGALRELDQAKAMQASADDAVAQAVEDLKQQHQNLTEQVEKKLQDSTPSPGSTSARAPGLPPGPGAGRAGPPGLPDLDLVRKWTGAPGGPQQAEALPALPYPTVKGVREDLRGSEAESRATTATPDTGLTGTSQSSMPAMAPGAAPTPTPNAPVGFPSMEAMEKAEKQAQAAAAEKLAREANYPTAHATREVFVRPGSQETGDKAAAAAGPPGAGATSTSGDGQSYRARQGARMPSRGMSMTMPQDGSAPPGFPVLNPNSASQQATMPQATPTPKPEPRPQAQQQQQQQQYYQQQQQQQQQQQAQYAQQQQYQQQQAQYAQQQAQYAQQQAQYAQQQHAAQQPAYTQYQQPRVATDWVIYRTGEGHPYYHNERTGETAWTLPAGVTAKEPGSDPAPTGAAQGGASYGHPHEQAHAGEADPFAELRRKEEEMRQQRENWASWYANYCSWYQQQATGPGAGAGMPGAQAGPGGAQAPRFGTDSGGAAKAAPKGPQPPVLNALKEDHATFAIKSSVLKEMEAMVAKGEPILKRKKALRCLQMTWHPDKNADRVEVAKSVFQFIEETKPWFLHDPDAEAN